MNVKHNIKYQNTDETIKNAFISLLQAKKIHTITINEICNKSHISRTTFYVHYEDIYALSHTIELEMGACLSSYIINHDTKEVILTKRSLYKMFEYVKYNKNIFSHIFFNSNSICEVLRSDLLVALLNYNIHHKEVSYQLNFFFGGLHQILQLWLKEDCCTPIDSIINTLYLMMPITKAIDFLL